MKVLEKGRAQTGWSVETICTGHGNGGGGCGAKLLVEEADLFRTSRFDYGGGSEHCDTFQCVECGVLTDLKDVPGHISRNLKLRNSPAVSDPL